MNVLDVGKSTDDQLAQAIVGLLAWRVRTESSMRWFSVPAVIFGGALFLVPSSNPLGMIVLCANGILCAATAVLAGVMRQRQKALDTLVVEIDRRGRRNLLEGLVIQPLDGTGFLPQMLLTGAASLVLLIGMLAWLAAFTSKGAAPDMLFMEIGVGIVLGLLASVGWLFILFIRSARPKTRI